MARVNLNLRALDLVAEAVALAQDLRIDVGVRADGGRTIDFGVAAAGGLDAGRHLARICLAGLGRVDWVPAAERLACDLEVQILTDHPIAACMASQYAGWQIVHGKYFAMGSGPMRAAAGREALFDSIGLRETAPVAVGILETSKLPPDEVALQIAEACHVAPRDLTLLAARTASPAGTVQIVARSVETALHKLHELGFDLSRVQSGYGRAPLPPVAHDDLAGIGRTNDAILYGARVTLWVRGDDDSLRAIGPRVPSSASPAYGEPFINIFEQAGRDFYQIDPHLFSPAVVTFVNLDSGRTHRFGRLAPDVLEQSFNSQANA
jgi:methenyltetrahydromethanopterin cyclohydrolase